MASDGIQRGRDPRSSAFPAGGSTTGTVAGVSSFHRPVVPTADTWLPDLLDCLLIYAVAEYESGRSTPIDADEIIELEQWWGREGFALDAERRRCLGDHRAGDLEWVELVLAPLWLHAGGPDAGHWSVELLHRITGCMVGRLTGLETWMHAWAEGVSPRAHPSIAAILTIDFPSPSDSAPFGRR